MLKKLKIINDLRLRKIKLESKEKNDHYKKEKIKQYDNKKGKIIVSLQHIQKMYGYKVSNRKVVLWDINLNIYNQDTIALVGVNGAGKSTLISIIASIIEPTSGKIYYNFDYNITPQEKIGIQFQKTVYPVGISVKNAIDFSLNSYKISISKEELKNLIDVFGITKFLHHSARSLSGGQAQRLNALIAILHDPTLILLDELTTGLDIATQQDILKFLKHYITTNKKTVLMASHNIKEMEMLCNRLVLINNGLVAVDALMSDIKKKYHNLETFLKKYM